MKTRLIDTLKKYEQKKGPNGIASWLLYMTESRNLSAGMRGQEIGGVYSPPEYRRTVGGSLHIQWADGPVSMTSLTRPLLGNPEELIHLVREFAFDDPFAPEIPKPEPESDVNVFSPAVEALLAHHSADLMSLLEPAQNTFQALGTKNCMAEVSCSFEKRMIASSRGLNVEYPATRTEFGATAESLYSVEISSREIITGEDIARQLSHLEEMIRIMRNRVPLDDKIPMIILSPPAAQNFIGKYFLENLRAETIYDRRSAFRTEDFKARRQRFHETFTLIHDPCRPLHAGSYRMDHQGIAAKPVYFIQNGRLTQAQVTLKAARQTGWEPTPLANPESLMITAAGDENLHDFIQKTERAYLVHSVLGLHTQDAGRGDYSVAVPHGIVIRDGKMTGVAKGILSGNFFDELQKKITTLATPYHSFKGMAFSGKVL
jgi:predicted Zn-dependent protease